MAEGASGRKIWPKQVDFYGPSSPVNAQMGILQKEL